MSHLSTEEKHKKLIYIMNNIYSLINDYKIHNFPKEPSLIILDLETYQKILAYDFLSDHIHRLNGTIMGLKYIVKIDYKEIEVK